MSQTTPPPSPLPGIDEPMAFNASSSCFEGTFGLHQVSVPQAEMAAALIDCVNNWGPVYWAHDLPEIMTARFWWSHRVERMAHHE